jgi:hypothetical protein
MDDPDRNNNKKNKLIIINIFFSPRYNPWWVLAYFTISFHNLLSLYFNNKYVMHSKGNAQELEMYNVIAQNVNFK